MNKVLIFSMTNISGKHESTGTSSWSCQKYLLWENLGLSSPHALSLEENTVVYGIQ